MPTNSYQLYSAASLSFGFGTLRLNTSYDPATNAVLTVNDDDSVLDGDLYNDDRGNDFNQFGTVEFPNGSTLGGPTTRVYSEEQYSLTAPGQPTITVYRIEINGTLAGYLPSQPMVPGVTYARATGNTVPGNSPGYDDIDGAVCIAAGNMISTAKGERPIGSIAVGDLVRTRDHGLQPVRWIGRRSLDKADFAANPKLRPVLIAAGALGVGLPQRDLVVSRQHRLVVASRITERMFEVGETLVPAIKLVGLPGISLHQECQQVEYVHLLFDRHEVIFCEGAPTESLFTGPQALKAIPAASLQELYLIFPQLRDQSRRPEPAMPITEGELAKRLAQRHMQNGRPLLERFQR